MKKYRKLEARKRVDQLHNQLHQAEIDQSQLALQQHLVGLEQEFRNYLQAAPNKRNTRKTVMC